MGLTDEEQAEIQQALEKQGEQYEQNDLDNLIKTGVSGSYDFIAKSIKDFEELIRNNPNHPKVPQVKAELAKLKPQLAQARKDSGMVESEKTDIGNYFTKSNPEVLKKQKLFLALTNELASREDLPTEEFIGGVQQSIKPSHDDGDFLKFASRALTRMITVMREKNDPRWREWNPIVREYQKRVLDRAIKRAYDPDQNDPRTMGRSQDDEFDESALMGYIGQEKYGNKGMAALSKAGREGASEEELGRIKDKYKKESEDLRRLAGLKEYDDESYISSSEFPKIRTDIKKNISGYPHIAIEYYNGDMWLLPQAIDGKPVFTNDQLEYDELLKRQLKAKGIGFPEKYDGDYTKRDGKWMSVEDAFDYESKASANSPYAKAQKQNIADLAAKGVDFDAELAKAKEAGEYPDPRIQDVDDFLGYLMQQHGVKDNTPSTYTLSGFGVDFDDDGYSFKDTSKFIKGGVERNAQDTDDDSQAGQSIVDRVAQQGRDAVDRISGESQESEDLRRLAGL